jgi:chromosome partitioning protein
MKILAIGNSKGGCGKTTATLHLAVAAEQFGLATVIFDLDPQASSTLFADRRGKEFPAVVAAQAPRLPVLLRQAREQEAALALLDCPPHAEDTTAAAVTAADAVLIPCRPSPLDLDAVGAMVRLARNLAKPAYVLISAAPPQGAEVQEMQETLAASGVPFVPVVFHQRKAFFNRLHEGMTATEAEPHGKAAGEARALLLWVCENVIKLPSEQVNKLAKSA